MSNDQIEQPDMSTGEPESKELKPEDFEGQKFLKNPAVGETLTFEVIKVVNNPNTTGKNKETGQEFSIGLKQKDGKVTRYDIETSEGSYTINTWEVYFKLLGTKEGLLKQYAKTHNNSFAGAKISIKRNFNGGLATQTVENIVKLEEINHEEAAKLKEEVIQARKEKRIYTVTLLNVVQQDVVQQEQPQPTTSS